MAHRRFPGPRAVLGAEITTYQDKWRQLAKGNVWKPVVRYRDNLWLQNLCPISVTFSSSNLSSFIPLGLPHSPLLNMGNQANNVQEIGGLRARIPTVCNDACRGCYGSRSALTEVLPHAGKEDFVSRVAFQRVVSLKYGNTF